MTNPAKNGPTKRGAQPGNTNAATHYLRSGQLPKSLRYIEKQRNKVLAALRQAVLDCRGIVTPTDGTTIWAIGVSYDSLKKVQRWERLKGDTFTNAEYLRFTAETARYAGEIARGVRELRLDSPQEDLFKKLYGPSHD